MDTVGCYSHTYRYIYTNMDMVGCYSHYQIFRAVRPHHQFFIYGLNVIFFFYIFGYLGGGGGWHINNQTGPILVPSYPLTCINLHIKYGSKPIRIF